MQSSPSSSYDTERAQAVVRLILVPLSLGYTLILHLQSLLKPELADWIMLLEALALIASLAFWLDIRRRPGNNPGRRILTMLTDYSCMALAMGFGGAAMLPVYALLLWVTVGNGLRYGSRYLLLATIMASLSLLVATSLSVYWQSQPYLVITLLLTTLMVPAYIHVLLQRSRRATEAERAANHTKSQFLAQASHDLRQPIHSISLFTACLRDSSLDDEQQRLVQNIDKSLHSVARLFHSILDMYSLDSGKVVVRIEPVALHELLHQLVQQNTEAAHWAGVDIRLHCPLVYVHADPALLTTMLQNLLSNALKYAPGRPMLIGWRKRGAGISIELYDKGRGIATTHLENIFEEFYRVRQVRDRDVEGMGLGLAIVRRLSKLMGLQVRIRSVEGKGTLAAIDGLQRTIAPAEKPCMQVVKRQEPGILNGLRVCLIEDDQNVLLATATLLTKWGCVVETHSSLPDVSADIDLVLTDYDLGLEASGADCIAHVRALDARQVPAIIMTGHEVRRVQEALGDDEIPILSKPVQPAELRSLLVALKLKAQAA